MGMDNYSAHQQKIIKRYYNNADSIHLQKLGEWVTELYLSEGKKREKLWQSVAAAMAKLGVPAARVGRIVAAADPKLVADLVTELQKKQ